MIFYGWYSFQVGQSRIGHFWGKRRKNCLNSYSQFSRNLILAGPSPSRIFRSKSIFSYFPASGIPIDFFRDSDRSFGSIAIAGNNVNFIKYVWPIVFLNENFHNYENISSELHFFINIFWPQFPTSYSKYREFPSCFVQIFVESAWCIKLFVEIVLDPSRKGRKPNWNSK